IAKRVYYKDWHFYNFHHQKTQTFYEFIIVNPDSIKINPKIDPKNANLITNTSIFIQKIITIKDWNQPPHSYRKFSGSFTPPIYNYFYYMNAWKHTFLFQNSENRHTWFFCFDKT
ncbi:hypothetical protein CFOL_v3_31719, partial [Cephalotus follicularis]